MRNPAKSLRNAQLPSPLPTGIVREISLDVARAAVAVIHERRWAATPRAAEAYGRAIAVITIDNDLGAVCDADYADMRVREMAEAAHAIVQAARADFLEGMTLISRILDADLVDPLLDHALAPAYAVVAFEIA